MKDDEEQKSRIMVCHVLRYAPFYAKIYERVKQGDIGEIINIQTAEHVGYDHMVAGYVRGKWKSEADCGSGFLMAKSCHDLDLITWFNNGRIPTKISSFGSRSFFTEKNAPEGATKRCIECPVETQCDYSAIAHYVDKSFWWDTIVQPRDFTAGKSFTREDKLAFLKTDDYGVCVWKSDNDVVDRQSVLIEFDNGSVATHNLVGGAAKASRTIHIIGTKGEIIGNFGDHAFEIRWPTAHGEKKHITEKVQLDAIKGGHGGGDQRLMKDFVNIIIGETPSDSYTSLEGSIYGHLIGFAAERSRIENKIMEMNSL